MRDQEKENEILVERVAKLEGQLVATQALIASSEQARENDSRKARRQLLAKDSRISEANEASKMMAEDMLASKARQAEALLEYSESMQLQAAALSSRLNEAIAATNEAAVNEDHSSHLEKVVQKCTSTIEDLRNSLAVESSKSDTLVTELQTVSTSREELKKDLESANARADVAEARAETALEKAKSAALLVEVAEERIQEARNRCEKAEEVAEAARKRCDIAERERHSIAQDRDEVVSASQENVIVAETAVAKLHEELSENRSAVANDAEEFASKALDALNAANVVSEARLAQIRREHSRILEDREIALSAAREEVSLHRQRALQYEAVAAKAFAEYAATAGAFAAGGIVSPKSTTGRTSTAHTVTDSINSQSELASANSMHSRSKSVRGFDARTSRIRTTPDARHVSPNNSVLEAALLKESNQDSTANDLNDTFGDPGEDPDSRKTFTTFGTFDDADEDVSSFATTKTLATVATATAWEGVFSQQDAASSRGVSPKKLAVHELESSMAPSLARILIATTAFHVGSHTQARRLRLLSWAAWKNYNHMGRWQTVASLARGYVIRSLLAQIAMRRCTTAFRQWHRNPVSKSTLSRESSRVPIRSASYGREKQGHPAYASIDRVAAMAAGISAAARLARGEPTNKSTTSQFTNRDGPILFRRSVDASGGVIGVDNKELCVSSVQLDLCFKSLHSSSGAQRFNSEIANISPRPAWCCTRQ